MPDLTAAIQKLRSEYDQKLDDLHDDYVHTRRLWEDLQARVQRYDEIVSVQNPITGSVVEGVAFAEKALASLERLRNRSFKDIVAQLELFAGELLRIWLSANPMLMSEKALTIATLLNSQSLADAQAAAVREAVESTITDKMYGRPEKWFNYLKRNVGVQLSAQNESSFMEMKARRDVLEHNSGIVEETYRDKAKTAARYRVGELIEIVDDDVDAAYQLVRELIVKIAADAIAKSNAP